MNAKTASTSKTVTTTKPAPQTPAQAPEVQPVARVLGKYAEKETKVLAEKPAADFDPNWSDANTLFVAGTNVPKSKNSRMGVLFQMVKDAGPEGITGGELASKLRHYDWNDNRSKYNLALPPIGWAEDYIKGAASARIRHLKRKADK